MKKLLVLIALVILAVSFVSAVRATATRGQVGDECNVHAEDESHMCLQGLTCVPQNENSEGNGKCADLNTASPTPTASPVDELTASPSATPTEQPENTPTPQGTQIPVPSNGGSGVSDGRNDGLGCGQHDCNTFKGLSPYDGQPVGWK